MAETKIHLTGPFAWAGESRARALAAVLGENNIRFVGGAVRDSLLGKPVSDIDVATTLKPEEVARVLKDAKYKVIPTGLKHGTVTTIIKSQFFEVTTLRHDVKTDGRRAEVAFHEDWQADGKRRDFTINAFYLAPDGTLYDYFGGRADLDAGIIRFIGNAENRIREDGLRILRLFRFHAWYGQAPLSDESLAAVKSCLEMLTHVSAERLQTEILKILTAKNPAAEFEVMDETGVLGAAFPSLEFNLGNLRALVELENELDLNDPLRRLGALVPGQGEKVAKALKLSNKEKKRLLAMAEPLPDFETDQAIRAAVYWKGLQTFEDQLLLAGGKTSDLKPVLKTAQAFDVPSFPIKGKDLEEKGFSAGPKMGEKLQALEKAWVESDFRFTKAELLKG